MGGREEHEPQVSHEGNGQWPPLRSHFDRELSHVPTEGGAGWWGLGEDFHFAQAEVPAQDLGTMQPVSVLFFLNRRKAPPYPPPWLIRRTKLK